VAWQALQVCVISPNAGLIVARSPPFATVANAALRVTKSFIFASKSALLFQISCFARVLPATNVSGP
jgi:hypothetical protein